MKRRFVSSILIVASILATEALATEPVSGTDFTFRRVKVPEAGSTTPRINVQIDPEAQIAAQALRQPEPSETEAPELGVLDWYWAEVSPDLADASPGRLEEAVSHLGNAPEGQAVAVPRIQNLQNIAEAHGTEILLATVGTNVSPALVLAVIGIESSGRIDALSSAGAAGLMQLMPATAERFGVADRNVASDNIRGGVAYLNWLMEEFDNDPVMVLASYNAGENAVRTHSGVPPFAETRAYVPKVLAAWSVAKGLCVTPPELISDGCVFAVRGASTNG
ncbi:lytic transglycosylase domain-containing protein [Pseudohalocynthiibacter aestuariivivens]|uniref:Lytic transglycosylase domain-containing protein n=1 Tax=Pseudohalocynthiibacter aestuariivivens TaxID=1591409 RepID=A0ABV5JC28_9RHOB|nr:lytic transglycosylase domain-containing protein [Pseudohalocynthiibacter aestuariivivens]MBS9718695.1 lytic transglycosylase domain-containing protein [Pseudohalocynthiibacter aestuariivivens]